MNRFLNPLYPFLPGCPAPIITAAVLETAIKFARLTWIWQATEKKRTVVAGEQTIPVTMPIDAVLIGTTLFLSDTGQPFTKYTRAEGATDIVLDDPVSSTTLVDVHGMFAPDPAATALPDLFYTTWSEAIKAGTKANLMEMPGKPWTDPQSAMRERRSFAWEICEARREARKTNDQTELRIQPRPLV